MVVRRKRRGGRLLVVVVLCAALADAANRTLFRSMRCAAPASPKAAPLGSKDTKDDDHGNDEASNDDDDAAADNMMALSELNSNQRRRRRLTTSSDSFVLFFIHVFKAAGSSVRTLLRKYADKCGKRWACLVTCAEGGVAKNGVVQCRLRDVVNVQRQAVFARPPGRTKLRRNPSAELLGNGADVVGGHFYYGMHAITERPYAYLTVLREPVATWISGLRYHNPKISKSSAADVADALVASLKGVDTRKRKYANAITYLVPAASAKGQPSKVKLELARRNLNLIDFVGLVESWPTTIELLRAALDPTDAAPSLWRKGLRVERNPSKGKSRYRGSDVLDRLDPDTFRRATDFLSAECLLYADAVIAHFRACHRHLTPAGVCRTPRAFADHINGSLYRPDLLPASLWPSLLDAAASDPRRRRRGRRRRRS